MAHLKRSAKMKKRLSRIVGLAVLAPFVAVVGVMATYSGRASTGTFGGFRTVQAGKEPLLYLVYTIGYFAVSALLFFMLWKEIGALRKRRRVQEGGHRFSGVIDP